MSVSQTIGTYEELREQALTCRPAELGLTRVAGRPVWGVVMETGCTDGTITLVATDDGAVSLLTSSGDVVHHTKGEWLHEAGARLTETAGDMLFECTPTWAYPLPEREMIRFYLLTFNGVVTAEAHGGELSGGGVPLSPLFYAGHDVLTLAHLASEDADWATYETALSQIVGEDGFEEETEGAEQAESAEPAASDRPEDGVNAAAEPPRDDAPQAEAPRAETRERSPLVQAAIKDDVKEVARLLAQGHDLDADSRGLTPLMAAAYVGAVEPLRLLLAAGAPVEIQDAHGFTALMFACNAGRIECARLLLDAEANVEASDAEGSTPIMFAAQHGYDDIVRLLLQRAADPTAVGAHGQSALSFATKKGLTGTVAILLGQES